MKIFGISVSRRVWLGIEFCLLFFGVPLWIFLDDDFVHPSMIVLPVLLFLFLYLRRHPDFKFRELIKWGLNSKDLLRHTLIVLTVFFFLLGSVYVFIPDKLFNLPRGNAFVWMMLSLFYPIFSAYGQEIIYRTFLFKRYHDLFVSPRLLITASAVAFSFVHIVYYSPVSLILTLIGGFYLAYTYHKTQSVLFVAVLHGLMGNIVFAVGLGEYFWLDMGKFLP